MFCGIPPPAASDRCMSDAPSSPPDPAPRKAPPPKAAGASVSLSREGTITETGSKEPVAKKPASKPAAASRKTVSATGIQIKVDKQSLIRDEEDLANLLKHEARKTGPGMLISFGFHLVILLCCAFMVITRESRQDPMAMTGGWTDPNQKQANREPVKIESVKVESAEMPTQTKAEPKKAEKKEAEAPEGPKVAVLAPMQVEVGGALAGRTAESKQKSLATSGGTAKTEGAVSKGLGWLLKQQKPDGHWELHQGYPDAGSPSLKTDTGATALALLAFLGAGSTHQQGPKAHQKAVGQAIEWLKKIQKPNGDLHDWSELGRQTSFYAHGQATIALCEAYAISHDGTLQEPVLRALQYIYESQHPQNGGWKYRPLSEGDLSVFGWQLMAIQTARMAGLQVPQEVLDRASVFLDRIEAQGGARYKYDLKPESKPTLAMTAEGLLCRQYLGWPRNHPELLRGIEYITQPEHRPNWSNGHRNIYFWYYGSQVLHNVQGEAWVKWNEALRDEIVSYQEQGGKQSGSWNPTKISGEQEEYAAAGGRLYMTTLCLLILEVYYRHLPLYGDAAPAAPAVEAQ